MARVSSRSSSSPAPPQADLGLPVRLHLRGVRDGPGVRHLRRAGHGRHPGRGHHRHRRRGDSLPRRGRALASAPATSRTSGPSTASPRAVPGSTPTPSRATSTGRRCPNPQIGAVSRAWARVGDDVRPRATSSGPSTGSSTRKPALFAGGRPAAGGGASPAPPGGRGGRLRGPRLRDGPRGGRDRPAGRPGRRRQRRSRKDHAAADAPRSTRRATSGWAATGRRRPRSAAGNGEIWRVAPDGRRRPGPPGALAGGMAMSPGGACSSCSAARRSSSCSRPTGAVSSSPPPRNGSFFRSLAFAPVTPETRKAGIAGDLFLVVVSRSMWMINEVIRISGPFDEWARQEAGRPDAVADRQRRPRRGRSGSSAP